MAEWSNATGCKPVDFSVYAGSNPAPSKVIVLEADGSVPEPDAKLRSIRELEIITVSDI